MQKFTVLREYYINIKMDGDVFYFYFIVLPTKEAQLIEQLISCLVDWMERDTNPELEFLKSLWGLGTEEE